jgi:hypothetical protein
MRNIIFLLFIVFSNFTFSKTITKIDDQNLIEIIAILDSVHKTDQKFREKLNPYAKKYGSNSAEMITLVKQINYQDSINMDIVSKIIDNYGWLDVDKIGEQGNKTISLVIQHSSHSMQEYYLPIMREAVKKGNANAKSLAFLEDRVAIDNGKKQIYGSQLYTNLKGNTVLAPIANPENVNMRRKAVGLGTIEEYIKVWNLTWDVERHKEKSDARMKEIEELSKYVVE